MGILSVSSELHICAARRLVGAVLETCGQYFSRGAPARRLDRFLAYFQRYLLAKPLAPLDVTLDFQVNRLLHGAQPNE